MTRLKDRKTKLRTRTEDQYRGRALIVELHPSYLSIREERRRQGYDVSYLVIFQMAAKRAAEHARAERAARRRGGAR